MEKQPIDLLILVEHVARELALSPETVAEIVAEEATA